MGWATLLADSAKNPFTSFLANNANALRGFGANFAQGTDLNTGFANGAQGAAQGAVRDDAYAVTQKAEADRMEGINRTVAMLRQRGLIDLADMAAIPGADMGSIYGEALTRMRPKDPAKPLEINGQLVDPTTYQVLGDFRSPDKPAAPPTSFQEFLLSQENPDYAASLSSSTSKPPTDAQRRSGALYSVVEPDAKLLLGDGANPGVFDAMGKTEDQLNPVSAWRPEDYQRASNAITNIAQSYLYAISGQAAPAAEVEKIVKLLTPTPFENPKAIADKKARLQTYVEAIKMGRAPDAGGQGGGADPLGIR